MDLEFAELGSYNDIHFTKFSSLPFYAAVYTCMRIKYKYITKIPPWCYTASIAIPCI